MALPNGELSLDILFLSQAGVHLEHRRFKLDNCLLAAAQAQLKLVDLGLVSGALSLHLGLVVAFHMCHLISDLSLQSGHLISVSIILSFSFLNVLLLLLGGLARHVLDSPLELVNLGNEAGLVLLLQLGVLPDLLSRLNELVLELLASVFALPHHGLVLSHVLLEVIEHLQFFVQRNQSVELVLELDFLLLKAELQDVLLSLVQHSRRKFLSDGPSRRRRVAILHDCGLGGACGGSALRGRPIRGTAVLHFLLT